MEWRRIVLELLLITIKKYSFIFSLIIWILWEGGVSCEEPGDQNERSSVRKLCTEMVWHLCVCDSDVSVRRNVRNATDIQANDSGKVFRLRSYKKQNKICKSQYLRIQYYCARYLECEYYIHQYFC